MRLHPHILSDVCLRLRLGNPGIPRTAPAGLSNKDYQKTLKVANLFILCFPQTWCQDNSSELGAMENPSLIPGGDDGS
jgi:hypothetical protein